MRFEDLRCLVEVANTGSITAASRKLFISQQAVSANIKKLEDELKCKLLIREKDGVSLTAQGQETVAFAHKMLDEKDLFCSHIQSTAVSEHVMFRVCSTSSVTNIVLPNVIDRMEAKQQQINLRIMMEDNIDELFERVKNNDSDIGLVTFNSEELQERFQEFETVLNLETLVRDELIGVQNKKYLSLNAVKIMKSEFDQKRQSVYNVVPSQKYLSATREKAIVWSNDSEFHRAMLERNGTMVLMPALAYEYFFSHKKYIALPFEHLQIDLIHAAVYRKDAPQYVQDFVNMIRMEMHMK